MDKTALLVLDIQMGILGQNAPPAEFLPLLAETINTARAHIKKVIYVTVSFRPGHPEVSSNNQSFAAAAKAGYFVAGAPETQIHPSVAPVEGDIVVEKKRFSAFTGSGLDTVLKGLGIDHLVLAGISTSAVVLSTLCEAADKDFRTTVLKDLCSDRDPALHEILMEKLYAKRGVVVGAKEWADSLKA